MGTTSRGYPYPEPSDPVDVPGDIEALAEAANDDAAALAAGTALNNGAVTAAKLATDAVETAKIKDANVTEAKLATGAVTEAKIGTGAVTSAKIADGTIVNADINASAAIARTKIDGTPPPSSLTITAGTGLSGGGDLSANRTLGIANGGVGTTQLADGAATFAKTSGVAPRTALQTSGAANNGVQVPNMCGNYSTVTQLDVRWVGLMPSYPSTTATLIGHGVTTDNTRVWRLFALSGNVNFAIHPGSLTWELTAGHSGAALPVDPATVGIRGVWRANNGSGTPDARIFTSADEGATWTLRATATNANATALFNNPPANIDLMGANNLTAGNLNGSTLWAEIWSDTGSGLTRRAQFDARAPMGPRYSDAHGNVWTITGSAWTWRRA